MKNVLATLFVIAPSLFSQNLMAQERTIKCVQISQISCESRKGCCSSSCRDTCAASKCEAGVTVVFSDGSSTFEVLESQNSRQIKWVFDPGGGTKSGAEDQLRTRLSAYSVYPRCKTYQD